MLRFLAGGMADLIWPPQCVACRAAVESEEIFCRTCADSLIPFVKGAVQALSFPRPPAFASATCAFEFGGQLAPAIRAMKYGGFGIAARRLGRLLPKPPAGLVTLAVPLSARRLRVRGFNQAIELARGAGLPPTLGCLERTRDTPSQTDLPAPARLANVEGAFGVRHPERLRGRDVALVDDVMTTGATAHACAQALMEAGARAVHVIALARAQPKR